MLPRVEKKHILKEMIPYQSFTRKLLQKKQNNNDITKLKLIKDFLEQDCQNTQSNQTNISNPVIPKLPLQDINFNINNIKAKTSRKKRENQTENIKKPIFTQVRSFHQKVQDIENQKIKNVIVRQMKNKNKFSLSSPKYTKFKISQLLFNDNQKRIKKHRNRMSNFGKINDIIINNRIN